MSVIDYTKKIAPIDAIAYPYIYKDFKFSALARKLSDGSRAFGEWNVPSIVLQNSLAQPARRMSDRSAIPKFILKVTPVRENFSKAKNYAKWMNEVRNTIYARCIWEHVPNVLDVFICHTDGGRLLGCMVTEMAEAGVFGDSGNPRMSFLYKLLHMMNIGTQLDRMHWGTRRPHLMTHGDIKLSNIVNRYYADTGSWWVSLIDYGSSKLFGNKETSTLEFMAGYKKDVQDFINMVKALLINSEQTDLEFVEEFMEFYIKQLVRTEIDEYTLQNFISFMGQLAEKVKARTKQ